MERLIQHELSEEDRQRHRWIRQQVEAEKDQMIAEDQLIRQLWALADEAKAVLESAERGAPPPADRIQRLRAEVEKALASRADELRC